MKTVWVCSLRYEVMVMADDGESYFMDLHTMSHAFLNDYDACKYLDEDHSNEVYEFMVKRHGGKRIFVNHSARGEMRPYDVD